MARHPMLSASRTAVVGALLAAAVLAVTEAVFCAVRSPAPLGMARAWFLAFAAYGLYVPVALGAALLEGLVVGAMAASGLLGASRLRAFLRGLREREQDVHATAVALALCGSLWLLALAHYFFHAHLVLSMQNRVFQSSAVAIAGLALLLPAALAFFPLYLGARRLASWLPRPAGLPRTALVLVATIATAATVFVRVARRVEWRVLDLGLPTAALLFALLQLLAALALGLAARRGPSTPLRRRGLLVLVIALSLLGSGVTLARFGRDPVTLGAALDNSLAMGSLVRGYRKLADRDHDGCSAVLESGDCVPRPAGSGPAGNPGPNPGGGPGPGEGGPEEDPLANQPAGRVDATAASPGSRPDRTAPALRPLPAERAAAVASAAAARTIPFDGNLLIVTLDTVRADRLGVAGYSRQLTPRLDALAREGTYFRRVYAQAPNTPRSFPSLVTSRYPSEIRWQRPFDNYSAILDDNDSAFLHTRVPGLRQIGIFSHFYFTPPRNIGRGFDEWDNSGALSLHDSNTDISAPRITPRVVGRLRQLAADKQRFLLWTHYFEPHSRYMEHKEFPVRKGGLAGLEERYDYEIAFVDRHLGQLLDTLGETGLAGNTAVIVFGDHGEQFGEHRLYFHGQTLYEEAIRVPLVIRIPGLPARVVEEPVMLVDLAPTLVDLTGGESGDFRGISLVPACLGQPPPRRRIYSELMPSRSWPQEIRVLVDGSYKLHYRVTDNVFELYDLASDPKEKRNLVGSDPERLAAMKRDLLAWMRERRP